MTAQEKLSEGHSDRILRAFQEGHEGMAPWVNFHVKWFLRFLLRELFHFCTWPVAFVWFDLQAEPYSRERAVEEVQKVEHEIGSCLKCLKQTCFPLCFYFYRRLRSARPLLLAARPMGR